MFRHLKLPSPARIWSDRRGASAVIFALSLIPALGFVGLAVDYGNALHERVLFNAAADSAVLTAVNTTKDSVASGKSGQAAIADGEAAAIRTFDTNAGAATKYLNKTPTVVINRSGNTYSASLSYSASIPSSFAKLFGMKTMPVGNAAVASLSAPGYMDFYMLLDVSSSMGIPSTAALISKLEGINPLTGTAMNTDHTGCGLACHLSSSTDCDQTGGFVNSVRCTSFDATRTAGNKSNTPVAFCDQPTNTNCIQIRLDAVGYAVNQLMTTAKSAQTITNQFRVGLYPFIEHLGTFQSLTSDLDTVASKVSPLASLIDDGTAYNPSSSSIHARLGAGGTHFENAFPELAQIIASSKNVTSFSAYKDGDGSSASNSKSVVFLVTDGAEDPETGSDPNWYGGRYMTEPNTAYCTTLKNAGVTVAILYTPYIAISPSLTPATAIAKNKADLESCASPGLFFSASDPSDITKALKEMFEQSVQSLRLTQ